MVSCRLNNSGPGLAQFPIQLFQALWRADVAPVAGVALATHLTLRHGGAQQRRQWKLPRLAMREQSARVQTDAAEGQSRLALRANAAIAQGEVTSRMLGRIIHQHPVRRAHDTNRQALEGIIRPDVPVDDQERVGVYQGQGLEDAATGFETAAGLVRIGNTHPVAAAVSEVALDLFTQMRMVDRSEEHTSELQSH